MSKLAVAGLSSRHMAEAAVGDGYQVVALDVFGDADTRAVSTAWFDIGEPAALRVDSERLLHSLKILARQGQTRGWVAGSGFDGRADLLARGAERLPLIGMAPAAQARLRDPQAFFGVLRDRDIDYPPVRCPPVIEAGNEAVAPGGRWLLKDFGACGGWHIRHASAVPLSPASAWQSGQYLQLEMPGQAMSATFVANGREARLLGVNQQIVRAIGASPFVYCGVVGPVQMPAALRQRLKDIVASLTTAFTLRGLASLDFLLHKGRVQVLEVNARPPASMALYGHWHPMAAHVRACLEGALPAPPAVLQPLMGHEIVFAQQELVLDAECCRWLTQQGDVHDLPSAGERFAPGQPVCSVSARGSPNDSLVHAPSDSDSDGASHGASDNDVEALLLRLQERRDDVLQSLEMTP
jgi:uncharacterized protein